MKKKHTSFAVVLKRKKYIILLFFSDKKNRNDVERCYDDSLLKQNNPEFAVFYLILIQRQKNENFEFFITLLATIIFYFSVNIVINLWA